MFYTARICLPGLLEKQSHLPNKALKCTTRFWWVINLKTTFLVVVDEPSWSPSSHTQKKGSEMIWIWFFDLN